MRRRLARALLAMAAIGCGTAAAAQTPPQDIPRVVSELRVETDHNGVNLVSGRTEFALPVLSVPAAPNLRFDRILNAAPYILGRVSGQAGEMPVGNWSIHAPGVTESFVCVDWMDCGSVTGTGSYFQFPRQRPRLSRGGLHSTADGGCHPSGAWRNGAAAQLSRFPVSTAKSRHSFSRRHDRPGLVPLRLLR
jgi:hypothetical protein